MLGAAYASMSLYLLFGMAFGSFLIWCCICVCVWPDQGQYNLKNDVRCVAWIFFLVSLGLYLYGVFVISFNTLKDSSGCYILG